MQFGKSIFCLGVCTSLISFLNPSLSTVLRSSCHHVFYYVVWNCTCYLLASFGLLFTWGNAHKSRHDGLLFWYCPALPPLVKGLACTCNSCFQCGQWDVTFSGNWTDLWWFLTLLTSFPSLENVCTHALQFIGRHSVKQLHEAYIGGKDIVLFINHLLYLPVHHSGKYCNVYEAKEGTISQQDRLVCIDDPLFMCQVCINGKCAAR